MSCPDCYQGHAHQGTPRGKVVTLHGLETYVTEPRDGRQVKGIIVVIPDAFGWEFVNNRILADNYADKGDYRVYLPDFMNGRYAPLWMLDKMKTITSPGNYLATLYNIPWVLYAILPFMAFNRPGRSYPTVRAFFAALRQNEASALPVGAAGFCWGGKHAVLLAGDDADDSGPPGKLKPLVDAAFTGHPSLLSIPSDVERLRRPVAFALGDEDSALPLGKVEEIRKVVKALPEESRGEVVVYPGCGHGFCVRADLGREDVVRQAGEAEDQCMRWFGEKFGTYTS